jgi:hypothetical protein
VYWIPSFGKIQEASILDMLLFGGISEASILDTMFPGGILA